MSWFFVCLGWGGSPPAAEEDPDHWKWARPDSGAAHAGQRQAGGEGEGSPERKCLNGFEFRANGVQQTFACCLRKVKKFKFAARTFQIDNKQSLVLFCL